VLVNKSFTLAHFNSIPANLLEEILLLIKTNIPTGEGTRELLFKSKFILTELLTNAIKHANTHEVKLNIEIKDGLVRFEKQDYGNPLILPKVKNNQFENAIIVTADVMHTLYVVEKGDTAYFYCHENTAPLIDTESDFPEHFGLLIITKAADEFSYQYNSENNLNKFTATVSI
jgi:hypothetical protein